MAAKPPFRADHVGSLLRPRALREARDKADAGELDRAKLRNIEDDAIRNAVAMQEAAGLHAITDGEFRRKSWQGDFVDSISGAAMRAPKIKPKPGEFVPRELVVEGRLAHAKSIEAENFKFLKSVTRRTPKLSMPSPTILLRGGRENTDANAYPDLDQLDADAAAVYRDELKALGAAGCSYVTLDDTNLAYLCDPKQREVWRSRGYDPDQLPTRFANLINAAIKGRPAGMTVCVHLCRGNFQSRWAAEGGYDPIAEVLFGGIEVDGYFLEYDTERAGGFEPLRFLPKHKKAVLGIVSSKIGTLESKDALKRRIDQAAKFAPIENLCLSPQCGFASSYLGNLVTEDDQKKKLARIAETAEDVWGTVE